MGRMFQLYTQDVTGPAIDPANAKGAALFHSPAEISNGSRLRLTMLAMNWVWTPGTLKPVEVSGAIAKDSLLLAELIADFNDPELEKKVSSAGFSVFRDK